MKYQLKLVFAMVVVGTIGLFVHYLSLSSALIAFSRALIGSLFIFVWIKVTKTPFDINRLKQNVGLLIGTGFAMGFNWIFLFEAYRYTTVSVATLCYYMAPVMIIAVSPWIFNEKLTKQQILLTFLAVLGAVLISGGVSAANHQSFIGIIFGLIAAVFYASIMVMNKLIHGVNVMVKTFVQLAISTIVMFVYVCLTTGWQIEKLTAQTGLLLLVIGILHTGYVYVLLFSAFDHLPSQTASLLTYIDPVTAIILSYFFLGQHMTGIQIIGTIMILLSTALNEAIKNE